VTVFNKKGKQQVSNSWEKPTPITA